MSYKDRATTAKDYANDHLFALWAPDGKYGTEDEVIAELKVGAENRGCDPESMYGFRKQQHPTLSVFVYEAYFKEKE